MTAVAGSNEENVRKSGSPQSGEPLSIAVGRIRRPHGVKGEVIFEPYPEYAFALKKGLVLLIGKRKAAYSVHSVRGMDRNYLITFEGVEDRNQIATMCNQVAYLRGQDLKQLPEDKNYPHEVMGMQVVDEQGKLIGILEEVLLTGANDVYVVKNGENEEEVLLPAIDSVILKIDVEKKVMTVKLPIWE